MMTTEGVAAACPYLGLADDADSHFSFAEPSQRCWAATKAKGIDLAYQSSVCLTVEHPACPRFRSAERPLPVSTTASVAVSAGPKRRAGGRQGAGRKPRRLVAAALLVSAGAIIAAAGYLRLDQGGTSPLGPAVPTQTAPVAAAVTPAPTLVPSPTMSSTPVPTPTTTPVLTAAGPSPAATAAPTPSPSLSASPSPIIYVVRYGDTLIGIAAGYGVSVADIVALNGILDPSLIHVGQRLVIP